MPFGAMNLDLCLDAFHEVNWNGVLSALAANGHDIENLECYQHWRARNAG